jgi:hypothetical protein
VLTALSMLGISLAFLAARLRAGHAALVGPLLRVACARRGGNGDEKQKTAQQAGGDAIRLPGSNYVKHVRTSMSVTAKLRPDLLKAGGWAVSGRSLALRPRLATGLP